MDAIPQPSNTNAGLGDIRRRYGFLHAVALRQRFDHPGAIRFDMPHGDLPGRLHALIGNVAAALFLYQRAGSDFLDRVIAPLDALPSGAEGLADEARCMLRAMGVEELAGFPVRDRDGNSGMVLLMAGECMLDETDMARLLFAVNAHFDRHCRNCAEPATEGVYETVLISGIDLPTVRAKAGFTMTTGCLPAANSDQAHVSTRSKISLISNRHFRTSSHPD